MPPTCLQMDFELLAGLFVWHDFAWISGVRNWSIWSEKPGIRPISFKLNMAEFGKCWKSLQTLKRLVHASNCISKWLRDCSCGFRVNLQRSEIGRFWTKWLGYSPWPWTWWILVSAVNGSNFPEMPPTCLQMDSNCLWYCSCLFSGEFARVWNRPVFFSKTLVYSPWPI